MQRSLILLSICVLLSTAFVTTAFAQPAQQLPIDTSGVVVSPTVQITEVKNIGTQNNNFKAQVKWSAQVPPTTKIEKFDVEVTITDDKGKTSFSSQNATGSAREIVLLVPPTGGKPKFFKANIITFSTPIVQQKRELTRTIVFEKNDGSTQGQANPSPTIPDGITNMVVVPDSGFKSFDIFWRIFPPNQASSTLINEKQFNISGTFTYRTGNEVKGTRTASTTVGSGARQARLTVSSSPISNPANIHIEAVLKVEAFFTVIQRSIATLSGNY